MNLFKNKHQHHDIRSVFGLLEQPPKECPTYLVRDVHKKFENALYSTNIIVVYGESRQGKTWMIERYCTKQHRIGCSFDMDLDSIKRTMLYKLGIIANEFEHTISEGHSVSNAANAGAASAMPLTANFSVGEVKSHDETIKFKSKNVDIKNNVQFIEIVKKNVGDYYFVFDNFHYLQQDVQKSFCSLLKDFNYSEIKIIIVGVWKDSSRITSFAPDLNNRCQHVDMGSWSESELKKVILMGEKALNITIDDRLEQSFIRCSVSNIGILKDIIMKFCLNSDVRETSKIIKCLDNANHANEALGSCYEEFNVSIRDRIVNLAKPKKTKSDSKYMRQKIVCAILRIMYQLDTKDVTKGINLQLIIDGVDKICAENGVATFQQSNITQELGIIHQREEMQNSGENFIPLFYYDGPNKKLLVIEPGLYMIKEYNPGALLDMVDAASIVSVERQ
jgi:endogenous inhibitor of DNA gyrase (YacG/DUF329 family)